LGICREEGLRFHEGGAMKCIGDVFFEMNDFETAMDHYIESLVIMEETGNRLDEAGTRINLANALISLHDLPGAERELTLSEKIYKELRSSRDRDTLDMAWASLHYHRKEFAEAKERLEKILSEVEENTITEANCKYNLAIIALMYDPEESENLLRESLTLHEKLGISKPQIMVSLGYGDPSEEWEYPPDNWEEVLFGKSR
jgi:tetratricopeptide (TPR) repeat protein